jgi:4-amino-4-deoxy-L-arabinose transferase-like glycosyltransferase
MPESAASVHSQSVNKASHWWRRARTSMFWLVMIAFGLRAGAIVLMHTYRFRTQEANFSFGWEMGRVAEALASGRGFGDPFGTHTGPTAWEAPLYPYLIAGAFQLFGLYSPASAFVLLLFSSLCSALTCIPVFRIALRCFGEPVAVWSAWAWALLPNVMFWSTKVIWETSLSALLLTTLFLLALEMEDRDGLRPWLGLGLLWGIAALTSPVLMAFLPASGLWAWYRRAKRNKRSLPGVALAAVVFIACVAPWTVRNYREFGKFVLIRDNFGAELRLGNGPGADGTWMLYLHPTQNVFAMRQYQQMGELAYIAMRKQQAMDYIMEDPGRFLWLTVKRFVYFWAGAPRADSWWVVAGKNSLFLASSVMMFWGLGRALRLHKPGAWLFFWLILLYPAVYYFVFPYPRYRHPIEPEILILAVFLISEATVRGQPLGRPA